jgi:hypothetical protein
MKTLKLKRLSGFLVAAAIGAGLPAQDLSPRLASQVSGYPGKIELSGNATAGVVTILISHEIPQSGLPTAFSLQYESSHALTPPRDWFGEGRILISKGVLAVIGNDGSRRLFMFPESELPFSLDKFFKKEDAFHIYGVSSYGQKTPLSAAQLIALKSYGPCGKDAPSPTARQVRSSGESPLNAPACSNCTSGGEGATQCGSGAPYNCTVTCSQPKYSACCNGATGNCFCCLN